MKGDGLVWKRISRSLYFLYMKRFKNFALTKPKIGEVYVPYGTYWQLRPDTWRAFDNNFILVVKNSEITVLKLVLCSHSLHTSILLRIRIRGSVPLTNGSGYGSCYFRQWPSRRKLKIIFFLSFFAYYFLKEATFTSSKTKSHKEVTKQYGRNQGFSYKSCLMIEGICRPKNMQILRIRIRNPAYRYRT
jgi:hypothetical protein